MKCKHCGKEITNDSNFCEFCGKPVSNNANGENKESPNRLLVWLGAALSFLFPIIGLFLHGFNRKKHPSDAKKYLWCAIIGFVLSIFAVIIEVVVDSNVYDNDYNYNYLDEPYIEFDDTLIYSQAD